MQSEESISIWFFIGISLLVNGFLILVAGVYEWASPPADPVVLAHLHVGVWWGSLLFLAGLAYCYFYSPARAKR